MARPPRNAGNVLPLLLLVVLVMAGGGYNYWRNLQAEPPRPYRSYGDTELAQLIAAYQGDVSQRGAAMQPASRGTRRSTGPLLQDRIDAFEAAQRQGNAYRGELAELAGQEGVLRQLLKERQARNESPVALHLRRLTTI